MIGKSIKICVIAGQGRMGKILLRLLQGQEEPDMDSDSKERAVCAKKDAKDAKDTIDAIDDENNAEARSTMGDKKSSLVLRSVYVRPETNLEGQPVWNSRHEARYCSFLDEAIRLADLIIDFSIPSLCMRVVTECEKQKKPLVIGTTGFHSDQRVQIHKAGQTIPILFSSNTSLGVNVLFLLTDMCRRLWEKNDAFREWNASIYEEHHAEKKDKPSGTAVQLTEILGEEMVQAENVFSRRVAKVVGEHRISICGPHESLELVHRAYSRDIFAEGAILGAKLLWQRKNALPRVYSMKEILQLQPAY